MKKQSDLEKIVELEREIAILPSGSISKKTIKGKEYYYHRIQQNGKRTETYIPFEEVPTLRDDISKRKSLERKLKELKGSSNLLDNSRKDMKDSHYHTIVQHGDNLNRYIALALSFKKRFIIQGLRDYVFSNSDKVFILYGLRRTGKTTMIRQIIGELPEVEFNKTAFIQVTSKNTLSDIHHDLEALEKKGFRYIFIDEVTLIPDFIEGASLFSDIYASRGMKIVLSGTDSLGFAFTREEQLYDRCIMLHATFIPYREFEEVLEIKGIDEYIKYGGTMSHSGILYKGESIFSTIKATNEYIDTAIAKNIQHSLKLYQDGVHFRSLALLYERNELTNVINRVVEDMNHRFTKNIVEKTFKSSDIDLTARNLLRDRDNPIDIKDHMDVERITRGMMEILDILNKEEQSVQIEEAHMLEIKEYLELLDLVYDIDIEYVPSVGKKGKFSLITQPGLRYAQADAIIRGMLTDSKLDSLSVKEKSRIIERLLTEISGRMMEEIILLETKLSNPDKYVFKLQFSIGEFDMVVFNPKELNCKIYEIKHSMECSKEQYRHLIDDKKCEAVIHRYGDITEKCVLYRGESKIFDGIHYLNVEEYLKELK